MSRRKPKTNPRLARLLAILPKAEERPKRVLIASPQAEALRAYKRELYRKRTPEQIQRDRDRARVRAARRRAQKRGCHHETLPSNLPMLMVLAYGRRCLRCKTTYDANHHKIHVDHIVPLVHGGPHALANLQPLCARCNYAKNTKSIDFRPDKGLKLKLMWADKGQFTLPARTS